MLITAEQWAECVMSNCMPCGLVVGVRSSLGRNLSTLGINGNNIVLDAAC